nr:hypothetical protein [Cytophagales bacterium]
MTKRYPYIDHVSIENLSLDINNPRLPKSKQKGDELSVIEFLLLEAATEELMIAIGENGFFEGELLLVVERSDEKGNYVVIEGNRRLTAVKLLNRPSLATVKKASINQIAAQAKNIPSKLPCLIFKEKEEILKYLGFRHITGIKSWRLLEKARYLFEMYSKDFSNIEFQKACVEIAKIIGSRADYVKRLLLSYQLYAMVEDEKFYQIEGLNDTKFFLNYFTDSLNKENIRNFLDIDLNSNEPVKNLKRENLNKLVHWWFEKSQGKSRVLGDSEGLKLLDAVLGDKEATDAFDKKGLTIEQAFELTGELEFQFEDKIKESLVAIEKADLLSNRIKSFYKELYDDLKAIRRIALKINELRDNILKSKDEF